MTHRSNRTVSAANFATVQRSTGKIATALCLAISLTVGLGGFRSLEANFAPSPDLWARWEAHDPSSTAIINTKKWDLLLKKYVQASAGGVDTVDYAAVTPDDRAMLDDFLQAMGLVPISAYNRNEQMAYWINLYNALTVKVVLEHFPVDSIRDIDTSPGWFADGPWGAEAISIEGQALTLNDIEHRILRPIWKDPRIHYAVNCASVGCPDLRQDAYTAENLETSLDAAARTYVNDARGIEIVGDQVKVSSIYDWFFDDFGGTEETLIAHLVKYAEPDLKSRLTAIGTLHESDYDWNLNAPR